MHSHDIDCVAAGAIMYSLARKLIPAEVIRHIDEQLDLTGLPNMATSRVEPGKFSYFPSCSVLTIIRSWIHC